MAEHAGMHTIATIAELATLPGTKPYCFCLENKHHYGWDGIEWIEFPNLLDITQEIADAIALAVQRANHTGTQSSDTLTDGTTNKAFLATERTKLSGIATSATANDTDANLKNRANHTGTQLASTISDFNAAAVAAVPLVSTNVFGYATGAGGTVTQLTSKSTAVTLNELCGQITMHNAALAAGAIVSFTLNNSTILANDVIVLNHVATATFGPYLLNARAAAGSAIIDVRNTSAGSLSNAIQIRFLVIRGVVS